jgi:hypothetical protein
LYFDGLPTMYQGAGVDGSGVLSMPLSVVEPASGNAFSVYSWSNLAVSNVPPGLAFDGFPASLGGGTNACVPLTGIPLEVGVFEVEVTGDLEISLFGNPYFIGEFVVTAVLEILPNPNPISGCTYPGAVNHLAYATVDDGTCLYAGCTDPEATNYYPIFILDDGSCVYGGGPTTCPSDVDQDGSVGTSDLLLMLSNFGMPCTN